MNILYENYLKILDAFKKNKLGKYKEPESCFVKSQKKNMFLNKSYVLNKACDYLLSTAAARKNMPTSDLLNEIIFFYFKQKENEELIEPLPEIGFTLITSRSKTKS